jgi:transposase
MKKKVSSEKVVKDIRRKIRKKYSSEKKIRIVLEGLRCEESIANLYRRESISENLYYCWSKDFLEAGKKRLMGDNAREASSQEVIAFKKENAQLKQLVAEIALKNRVPVDDRLVAGLTDIELGF